MIDPIPFFSGSYILPRTIIGAAFPISKKGLINLKKLTKQIISVALGAVTAASCGTMAFAADKTLNQDTPSGSSTVEYSEESTYTATIPEYIKVQKMSEDVDTNANSVTLRDVIIPDGKSLVETVTYNGVVAEENNVKIPYKLVTAEGDLTSGSTIITQTSGKSTEEKTSHFGAVATESPKYSGYYTDTATFSFDEVGEGIKYLVNAIKANNYTLNIGATKPEYVVAKFNKDFSKVIISKNGNDSDGKMKNWAMYECEARDSLKSVVIEEGVTSISECAFQNCKILADISIANSVDSIGDYAFQNCYSLNTIAIPSGVTGISERAFNECPNLKEINVSTENDKFTSQDGILYFNYLNQKKALWRYPEGKSGEYSIPDSVISVNNYAFYNCDTLANVTIPSSVNSIGNAAFSGCEELTDIAVPDSVQKLGDFVFSGCTALATAALPDSVTTIGSDTFNGCTSLKEVTLPSNTNITNRMFYQCSSLENIVIPNSVKKIGAYAFTGCAALKNVTLSSNITYIADNAFNKCGNLKIVYGTTGSYAETWAKNKGYTFVAQ